MPVTWAQSGLTDCSEETQHRKMQAAAREMPRDPRGSAQALHKGLGSWDPVWDAGAPPRGMGNPSEGGLAAGGGGSHGRVPEEAGDKEEDRTELPKEVDGRIKGSQRPLGKLGGLGDGG